MPRYSLNLSSSVFNVIRGSKWNPFQKEDGDVADRSDSRKNMNKEGQSIDYKSVGGEHKKGPWFVYVSMGLVEMKERAAQFKGSVTNAHSFAEISFEGPETPPRAKIKRVKTLLN
ncbi:unnamed protein product [Nezara viridula]|uniref:Uncharacterized protein n=1 Tax=Nezara viridula TaxID=85310 RepID=A0A9P0MTT3_NEZVI|nr:unnamed protein product [Nezara viridula]